MCYLKVKWAFLWVDSPEQSYLPDLRNTSHFLILYFKKYVIIFYTNKKGIFLYVWDILQKTSVASIKLLYKIYFNILKELDCIFRMKSISSIFFIKLKYIPEEVK